MTQTSIVTGRQVGSHLPDVYIMTAAHTDEHGMTHPAGTEYTVLSGGHDGLRGGDYQTVSIDGRRITFRREA